jgi:hypothetical protein
MAKAVDTRTNEEIEDDFQRLMHTQQTQDAAQNEAIEAKVQAKKERLESRRKSGRKLMCPRMKAGRMCNDGNSNCKGSLGEFHHPPVCKDLAHTNLRKHERPDSCVLWHLWKASPNGNGGTKSYTSNAYQNKFGNNSNNVTSGGDPRQGKGKSNLEKENERLKKAAANQLVELAKSNARYKAYKQTTQTSYSSMTASPPSTQEHFPALPYRQSPVLQAAAAAPLDLVAVLTRMEARMEAQLLAQAAKIEMLMSLSGVA